MINRKIITFIAIGTVIIGGVIPNFVFAGTNKIQSQTSENSKITANIQQYLSALEQNQNFHGTVLVSKGGKIILDKGYGMADYEKKIKNTTDTKFAIASDTKQFTALAIMQLQEKGILNVNDKLSKYLPDFPNGDKITLHNLLTHTSGIPDYLGIPSVANCKNMKDIISILKNQPLDFQPSKGWNYSNSGYMILAYIIEKTSGISYGEYLKKYIFSPLGMKNSGVCYDGAKQLFNGKGYEGALINKYVDDTPLLKILDGAGNVYSTVGDMYIWDRALKNGKLLSKKYFDMMFKGYTDTTFGKDFGQYGYGWFVLNSSYGKKIFHTGGILGFTSVNSRYVDKDVDIIILTNSGGQNILPLEAEKNIMAILSGNKVALPTKKVTVKINPAILKSYVGEYELVPGFTIIITLEGNNLFAQATGQEKFQIFQESETKFYYKVVDAQITFVKDNNGNINKLILHQNGQDMNAPKKK